MSSERKHKRGRRSSIDKLPEVIRVQLNKDLRDRSKSQAEILKSLNYTLATEGMPLISRSALSRYSVLVMAHVQHQDNLRQVSEALVEKFGVDLDNKTGRALIATAEGLVWAAMSQMDGDDIDVKQINTLTLALGRLVQAGKHDAQRAVLTQQFTEKQAVEVIAEAAQSAGGLSETAQKTIAEALGIPLNG